MQLLKGKTAIITGASRGIGRGIAKVFAEQGCHVAFTYSSSVEAANALEKELIDWVLKPKDIKAMPLILKKHKNSSNQSLRILKR